jgi:hypothetical protein
MIQIQNNNNNNNNNNSNNNKVNVNYYIEPDTIHTENNTQNYNSGNNFNNMVNNPSTMINPVNMDNTSSGIIANSMTSNFGPSTNSDLSYSAVIGSNNDQGVYGNTMFNGNGNHIIGNSNVMTTITTTTTNNNNNNNSNGSMLPPFYQSHGLNQDGQAQITPRKQNHKKIKNYSGKLIYDLNDDDSSIQDTNDNETNNFQVPNIFNGNSNNFNNADSVSVNGSNSSSRASSARKSISFFVSSNDDENGMNGNDKESILGETPESAKQIKKKEIILKRLEMSRKASNVRKNSEKKLNSSKSESSSIKEKKIVKKSSVDEKEIQNKKQFISINNKSNLLTENSTSIMVTEPVDVNSKSTEKEIDSEMVNEIPEETAAVTADFTPTPVPPSVKIGSNHHIKSNIHMRKFKLPNNKNLMKNALNTILGGKINEKVRKEAIQSLEHSDQNHFIILFQNNEQHIFRGLYSFNPENDQSVQRIYSVNGNKSNLLPEVINPSDVYEYYKYDTGSRSFQKVHTKSFQRTTHACALIPSYFKRGSKK